MKPAKFLDNFCLRDGCFQEIFILKKYINTPLQFPSIVYICTHKYEAGVVELVDTLDLGSSAARCMGSSPFARTRGAFQNGGLFCFK